MLKRAVYVEVANSGGDKTSRPRRNRERVANLPAGLERKTGDGHAVDGAARARSHAWCISMVVTWTGAPAGELDDQTFTHELGSI